MFNISYVSENDKSFWYTFDGQLSEGEFQLKTINKRGYIVYDAEKPIGIMRYNLMWDIIPFLTLIYLDEHSRGKGFGKQSILYWENEMRGLGFKMVMTSTRVDEEAQHFYRKLGYLDRGSLFLDNTPIEQAQEMVMIKIL